MPLLAQWKKWTGLRASRGDREELSGGAEPVPRIAGPGNLQGVSPLHEEGTGRLRDPVETGGAGRPFSPLSGKTTRATDHARSLLGESPPVARRMLGWPSGGAVHVSTCAK